MGVATYASTMPGGVTPTCNDCGVALCFDISEAEYDAQRDFWEAWRCVECNGGVVMDPLQWERERRTRVAP